MDAANDLFVRWMNLEQKMVERFGKKPDLEAILFLIGIQEFGQLKEKYTKEQKQDLCMWLFVLSCLKAVILSLMNLIKMAGRTLNN